MTTIAVIDDDSMLIELTCELLRERDWHMIAVQDGNAAVETVRRTRPDAIVLDVRLKGTRAGWDIVQELKAGPDTQNIPIVVWSGDSRFLESKQEWLSAQQIQVLRKPFDIDDLFGLLDRAMGISAHP